MSPAAQPSDFLKTHWGFDHFRPKQEEIIHSVLQGNDTLALLPTGGGKSLCYQIPALMLPSLTLVISPLIALMKDQVENLRKKGIASGALYTGMSVQEQNEAMNFATLGVYKLLYVSPERLKSAAFKSFILQCPVSLIAVDEAHCISQWGHDFRPDYLSIAAFRNWCGTPPVIALTATATHTVVNEICQLLSNGSDSFKRFSLSFERSNLQYEVFEEHNKKKSLVSFARQHEGTGIVYLRSRLECEEWSAFLAHNQLSVSFYHAGLDSKERASRQEAWKSGSVRIMVCTNAFGMGIDKEDVRWVIHGDIPEDPEAYYQEAGRAGRDGKSAHCVLYYNEHDLLRLKQRVSEKYPSIAAISRICDALGNYFQLPVGAGAGVTYSFEMKDFCKRFNLKPVLTFHALSVLERNGFIRLNDDFKSMSTLRILVSNSELYAIQVAHPSWDQLIATVLRLYGGQLFVSQLNIDEDDIASRLSIEPSKIKSILKRMHDAGVWEYNERVHGNSLTWLIDRLPSASVNMSQYHMLKERAVARTNAMTLFVTDKLHCRSLTLLKYFGESSAKPCGLCDVCARVKLSGFDFKTLRLWIDRLHKLKRGTILREDDWIALMPEASPSERILGLQWLSDEKIIGRNNEMEWQIL